MPTPAIDPEIQALLDASDDPFLLDPDSVFRTTDRFAELRIAPDVPLDPDVDTFDCDADGVRLRVHRPRGPGPQPVILLFHSGGWSFGSPEAEESRALRYAREVDAVVVSVDYRLAPEHPFPAAIDDAYASLLWVVEHAEELDADRSRLAVAGCSAGGNLAAATALRARDEGGPPIAFQLLIYPALDDRLSTISARTLTDVPVLTSFALRQAWSYYGPDGADNGYGAPARATSVEGLPPTMVMVAEVDPVRDDGLDYAARLSRAGVSTAIVQVPGAVHGFDLLFADTTPGERALATQVQALRDALN